LKIAIVNDVAMAAEALRRVVVSMPNHCVAWMARDGAEAVHRCRLERPDLILMDLIMPVMNGPEAIRNIMANTPCAILVVTASVGENASQVFEALGAGAIDVVQTPVLRVDGPPEGAAALRFKMDMIARQIAGEYRIEKECKLGLDGPPLLRRKCGLVAIGASAGGPAALATILGGFPADFPAGVVIVQHIDLQFLPQLAGWLNQQSPLPVRVAVRGDRPQRGVALLAGTGDHLVFLDSESLGYTPEPKASLHRPSVDVFFESIARHWKGDAVGVILTGMGRDGAKGLKSMKDAGFHTIVQDQASCVVYGMPKAATEADAAVETVPMKDIARRLINIFARQQETTTAEMKV